MRALLLFFLSSAIGAQTAPSGNAPTDKALNSFFQEKTKIDNPLELRDPFKAPLSKTKKKEVTVTGSRGGGGYTKTDKGEFGNIAEAPITNLDIYNLKVVGVLIGRERRAMVNPGTGNQIIVIREGMKLGPDAAEVKAILPGGIVLVEKIVNVYGQEEYLETVIPISR